MGAMLLFPRNRVDGKPSINQERGRNPKIADRFDLTIECIRKYYANEDSPLAATFERYSDFFGLFNNFAGYTNFFLLDDLVSEDGAEVLHFMPFGGFDQSPLPSTLDHYLQYRAHAVAFVESRNSRMLNYVASL